MAGEIQEPLRFNFQEDLLQSGSISFGRFESESLSWEKRSSFSHNRYLEEVEKYSKPGSVTEMKAYFEAHFKRKALLKQTSSEIQDGRELLISENNDPQHLEDGNDVKHFTCFDDIPHSSGHSNNNEETDVKRSSNENVETLCSHATNIDESLCDLSYEGVEVMECERNKLQVFSAGRNDESMLNIVDNMGSGPEHLNLKEIHHSGTENVVLVKTEVHIKETVNNKDDDSVNSRYQQKFPSKVRPAAETKQPKTKPNARANFPRVQRIIPAEPSSCLGKAKTRESKGLLMKEKEKKSPRPASPIFHPLRKTPKPEESSMSFPKAKIIPPSKSIVKECRSEKTTGMKSPATETSHPGARQVINRTKHPVFTPSKPRVDQSAAVTFRSDQRAERRKEEKGANEMTQSRKSLNFKATPIQSFFKETSRCSNQNKVVSTNKTPNRPQTVTMTPHTNRYISNSITSSTHRPSSSTSLTSRNHPAEPSRRVPEKKKESRSQKQKEPEATKGPRARDTLRRTSPRLGYLSVSIVT